MTPWQLWGLPILAAIVTVIVTAAAFRQKELPKEQVQEQSEAAKAIVEARRKVLKREEQTAKWLDLLKLEYEKAADRYENIYRAIWQNFSYMAIVAGGILTFAGKDDGDSPLTYFWALTPLFFWFVATFLPLNHYGEAIRERLRGIENDVNEVYFPNTDDPKLAHFKLFHVTHFWWRVRTIVAIFGIAITIAWVVYGIKALNRSGGSDNQPPKHKVELRADPLTIEVRDPALPALLKSMDSLARAVYSIDSSIKSQSRPTQPATPGQSPSH